VVYTLAYIDDFDGPSLVYPNGGEIFYTKQITIQWLEPTNISSRSELIFYEIFFIESYSKFKEPEWVQIANVPIGNSSFTWDISSYVKGTRCRIGIRAVTHEGKRSKMSYSAASFSVLDKKLPKPAIIEPITGEDYYSYVPFILDKQGIINECSERASYKIYYSSESLDIDWTLIIDNIPVNTEPIYWDVRNYSSASDYDFKVELVDEQSVSEPVFIRDVIINGLNYFVIDTEPPTGSIKVVNNSEYIKDKDVILSLSTYDKTTGTEYFKVQQLNVGANGNTLTPGPFEKYSDSSTWHLKGDDGVKLIQVKFRDYAGNTLLDDNEKEYFRTYKSLSNNEVTSILSVEDENTTYLWIAFGGSSPQLYLNRVLISSLDGEATSMVVYNNVAYISIKDSNNKGILQRYISSEIETVYQLTTIDSVINSMIVFDSKIFMGLQNGRLMSFDGSTVKWENEHNLFDNSILNLETDGNILFIFLDYHENIWTMRKSVPNIYFFDEIDIEF